MGQQQMCQKHRRRS